MPAQRILIVHNRYRIPGGEDTVVETESRLLRDHGCDVAVHYESNDGDFSPWDVPYMIWPGRAERRLQETVERFRPEIAHFHNIYYRLSPSAYWMCQRAGVSVVQTLHNFRLGCANARLNRDGQPCELCISGQLGRLHGVFKGCFQNSTLKTAALNASILCHQWQGTFERAVDRYICLSEFARTRHLQAGVPADRLVVKGNCVHPDPGCAHGPGEFAFFAGRLEPDKGIHVLLQAAAKLPADIPVWIAGEGSCEDAVRSAAASIPNLRFLGQVDRPRVLELMQSARLLLFPTMAYENFPMSIAEALAVGLPVVTSGIGASAEVIRNGETGVHFETGSPGRLADAVAALWDDSERLASMRRAARADYLANYSSAAAYQALQHVYDQARGVAEPVFCASSPAA